MSALVAMSPPPPLQELVGSGTLSAVPDDYIIPEQDRPRSWSKEYAAETQLPVIDMAGVQELGGERRRAVVELIRKACLEWGSSR